MPLCRKGTAEGKTYVGGGIGIGNLGFNVTNHYYATVVGNLFAGYGKRLERDKNIYLGGEINGEFRGSNQGGYGVGASILPGYFITQNTMLYGRVGAEAYHDSYNHYSTIGISPQFGIGAQTQLNKHWGVRAEYINSRHSQASLGLVYKFN